VQSWPAEFLGWITLLLGFAVVQWIGSRQPRVRTLLTCAFLIRAIFALVHHYVVPLPDSQADAVTFELIAARWAQEGFLGALSHFTTGAYLYSWVISLLYSLTTRSPLMAQGVNVLFGTLIVWNVYRISRLFWNERLAHRAGYAAAFFPTLVLYSAITLREVAVVFPFTLGILYFVKWIRKDRTRDFVGAFITFWISSAFHTGTIIAILVLTIAAFRRWLDAFLAPRSIKVIKRGVALGILVLGVYLIVVSGWGLEKLSGLRHVDPLSWLSYRQEVTACGRAAYLENMQTRTVLDLVWQTPIRVAYFLFAPFPWMVRSPVDLLGAVMSFLNLVLVLLLLHSLRSIWTNREARWSLYILVGMLIGFALAVSNYGTSIRHTSKLVPLALALAKIPRVKLVGGRTDGKGS